VPTRKRTIEEALASDNPTLALARIENAALRTHDENGLMVSQYSDEDKVLAMTCNAVTKSPTRAARLWAAIHGGTEEFPMPETIRRWGKEGVLPSLQLVEFVRPIYQAWALDGEMDILEAAQKAVGARLAGAADSKDSTFHLNGVLMTSAERTHKILFPPQTGAGGASVSVNLAPIFNTSPDAKRGWENTVEGEAREVP
jgi:hypothetical protein